MMNGQKEQGRTCAICRDRSRNREERQINRWIDRNALLAFFFLLILSSQLKRLSVSLQRLSQQRTVSIICFLLSLFLSSIPTKGFWMCVMVSLSTANTSPHWEWLFKKKSIRQPSLCYLQGDKCMKDILNEQTLPIFCAANENFGSSLFFYAFNFNLCTATCTRSLSLWKLLLGPACTPHPGRVNHLTRWTDLNSTCCGH